MHWKSLVPDASTRAKGIPQDGRIIDAGEIVTPPAVPTPFQVWKPASQEPPPSTLEVQRSTLDVSPSPPSPPSHPADTLHAPPAHWARLLALEQQRTRQAQRALADTREQLDSALRALHDAGAQQATLLQLLTTTRAQLAAAKARTARSKAP
jgi:hypothetical protein